MTRDGLQLNDTCASTSTTASTEAADVNLAAASAAEREAEIARLIDGFDNTVFPESA